VTASANVSLEEIRALLIDYLSDVLEMAPTELSTDRPLQDYGADSVVALSVLCRARVHL
jgi:acyl carrier protein